MNRLVKALGVIATVGMFLVLIMGSTVTNTGSEAGCGRSWPLCRGRLIPQFAVQTAIEFSHRAVVGVETMLILAFAAVAVFLYRRRDVQILAGLMVAFLFLQAGLGAWAVMYPQLAPVLALHFGVSLVSFASVLLTTVVVFEAGGGESLRNLPVSGAYRSFVWALTVFSYVVVYLGAYVRHTKADLACLDWPLCNGAVVPPLTRLVANVFFHRLAALILAAAVVGLVVWSARMRTERPDLFRAGLIVLGLVLLQTVSGAIVVFTHLDLFSALLHAGLVGLMFGALTYLCMHVLPLPRRRTAVDRSAALAAGFQR